MKRLFAIISVFAVAALTLTGCSPLSALPSHTNQNASTSVAGNDSTNSTGGLGNVGNTFGQSNTGNPSSAETGNQTGSSAAETGTQLSFQGDVASVLAGIQSTNAQMLPAIHASVVGHQYGLGMKAVTFVSRSVGYLAGQGIILKTTDGGQVFQPAYRGNVDISGVSVATTNPNTIVAWGRDKVLVSQDAGSTWKTETLPALKFSVQEVDFATSREGFAVTGDSYSTGSLWRTTDGGVHWQKLSTRGKPMSVSFGDASTGWIGMLNGSIYETKDSGAHWTLVFQPNVKYPGRPELHAVSPTSCWVMVIGQSGMSQTSYSVFRTTDGIHWKPVLGINTAGAGPAPDNASKAPKGPGSSPGPMVALSSQEAIVTGVCRACAMGSAQVSSTQNGGSSWTTYPTIPNGMTAPTSMSFVSKEDGWVLDSFYNQGSFLLHTADGGKTWAEVYPMIHPHPIQGVSFLNGNVGYGLGVPGDANAVLKSTDGGKTWSQVGSLPAKSPNMVLAQDGSAINFVSETVGYAIGPDGNLYQTEDGGRTWRKTNLVSIPHHFNSVTFLDNGKVGMVTTYYNEVEVTIDGGKTWHVVQVAGNTNVSATADLYLAGMVKLPVASTLKTMVHEQAPGWTDLKGGLMAWMAAQNGRGYFMTTDGGVHWQEVDLGTGWGNLQPVSLDFANGKDGWMITFSGALLRTTDGGKTWLHAVHPHS